MSARRGYRGTLAVVLAAAATYAVSPGAASAGSRHAAITPAYRADVHAYLADMYTYVQALAEVAPAVVANYEAATNRIADECSGVLAGVPQEAKIDIGPSVESTTARQRGEEKRRQVQLRDLESELRSELDSAEQAPRRPAAMSFLASLKALPQSDPALSRVVHEDIAGLEEGGAEGVDACADMKAWVASGYRTLSPASRAIALKSEAELVEFLKALSTQFANESVSATETPADKALVRKTTQLEARIAKTIGDPIDSARKRVEVSLGLKALESLEKESKSTVPESDTYTKIGSVHTAAGTKHTIWLDRKKSGSGVECKLSVEVRGADGAKPGLIEIIASSGAGACLKPHEDHSEPSVKCKEGLLTIEGEVLSATRTVDLRMSNGTRVVSRPTLVSHRMGGPDAFYYQVVRGPSPIPVSLIERDAHGRMLREVKLSRIVGCSKHPLKYLAGGKRTLVHGQTPQGPDFSIVGERYRLFGRVHRQLKLTTGKGLVSSDESGEEELSEGLGESFPVKRTTPLDSELSTGCSPHEYSIFYGLLNKPRDTVFAKIAGMLIPLIRVHIPASLHAGGVLVYMASAGQPEEIVVRSPSGKVVMSEDRGSQAVEGREKCEGESEGSVGPPPGVFGETGETSRIVLDSSASTGPLVCSTASSGQSRSCSIQVRARRAAQPRPSRPAGTHPRRK